MANSRPNLMDYLIEHIEGAKTPEQRAGFQKALWEHVAKTGTPLITNQDGKNQAIFLYQEKKPELDIRLKSADLYDRLTQDGKTENFKQIPGTDIYYLKVDDLPPNACVEYAIQVFDKSISDPNNKKNILEKQRYDLDSSKVVIDKVSYLKMPQAELPEEMKNVPEIIKIKHDSFHSNKYPMFVDRSVFTYEPEGFKPETGRFVFMLDGEEMCKSLIPNIEAMSQDENSPFYNTAIVFIDSKTTKSYNSIPDRVNEFYYEKENFSKMLYEDLIPEYSKRLGVTSQQVILAAHSLAAYPVLDIAAKHADKIGGIILASPALNQNQKTGLLDQPSDEMRSLPIYMQIGQLEDAKPPREDLKKDMKDQSSTPST